MTIREHIFLLAATILSSLFAASTPAFGQWIHYEKKNVPRLPDGKVNMTAPAPRQADGKPDLSGIWLGDNGNPPEQDPILRRAKSILRRCCPPHKKNSTHAWQTIC